MNHFVKYILGFPWDHYLRVLFFTTKKGKI